MFYAVLYEKGKRACNQDSIVLQRMKTRIGDIVLAAVCDGLGGEDRGEIASGYIAEELSRWFAEELPRLVILSKRRVKVERSLSRMLFHAHEALRGYGAKNGIRCGTTMTAVLVIGEKYLAAQIGDSMSYYISVSGLSQLKPGGACPGRAKCFALMKRQGYGIGVERCLGIGRYHPPVFRGGRMHKKCSFLLLSDGLLKGIGEKDFANVLSPGRITDEKKAQRGLRTLAEAALRRGSTDNMSAVYLC